MVAGMAKDDDLWLCLEKDYRTGIHSNRALAEKYDVSEAAIRKRARLGFWLKDLSAATASATRAKLTKLDAQSATEESAQKKCARTLGASERETIDKASDVGLAHTLWHRKTTDRVHRIADQGLDRLEAVMPTLTEIADIAKAAGTLEALGRSHKNTHELDQTLRGLNATPPAPPSQPMPLLERLSALLLSQLDARRRAPVTVGPAVIEHVPGGKK